MKRFLGSGLGFVSNGMLALLSVFYAISVLDNTTVGEVAIVISVFGIAAVLAESSLQSVLPTIQNLHYKERVAISQRVTIHVFITSLMVFAFGKYHFQFPILDQILLVATIVTLAFGSISRGRLKRASQFNKISFFEVISAGATIIISYILHHTGNFKYAYFMLTIGHHLIRNLIFLGMYPIELVWKYEKISVQTGKKIRLLTIEKLLTSFTVSVTIIIIEAVRGTEFLGEYFKIYNLIALGSATVTAFTARTLLPVLMKFRHSKHTTLLHLDRIIMIQCGAVFSYIFILYGVLIYLQIDVSFSLFFSVSLIVMFRLCGSEFSNLFVLFHKVDILFYWRLLLIIYETCSLYLILIYCGSDVSAFASYLLVSNIIMVFTWHFVNWLIWRHIMMKATSILFLLIILGGLGTL